MNLSYLYNYPFINFGFIVSFVSLTFLSVYIVITCTCTQFLCSLLSLISLSPFPSHAIELNTHRLQWRTVQVFLNRSHISLVSEVRKYLQLKLTSLYPLKHTITLLNKYYTVYNTCTHVLLTEIS